VIGRTCSLGDVFAGKHLGLLLFQMRRVRRVIFKSACGDMCWNA
jgi:hypothetical protein